MAFSIYYIPLFNVNILHHYFLNNGTAEFNLMNETEKAKQLKIYNSESFLTVKPTLETKQKLNGHNLVCKNSKTGITIWSKVTGNNNNTPFISFDNGLSFTFLIQIKDSIFYNYTDLKMENAEKLYYLSNQKPATESVSFPLINKAGGNFNINENFVLSEDGEKAELGKLNISDKNNLFGLVQIFMKGETSSLDVTNAQGDIPDPSQIFDIVFKNRNTIWRYFFDSNQQVKSSDGVKKENGNSKILITKIEQPLTQNGFISIELDKADLPNPGAQIVKPESLNKYYSEIYM